MATQLNQTSAGMGAPKIATLKKELTPKPVQTMMGGATQPKTGLMDGVNERAQNGAQASNLVTSVAGRTGDINDYQYI